MELVVLGADGTWPEVGGATSGYLVRHEGFTLWVDMGTGTMAKLQEHEEPFAVDAIILSHQHPDHFLDLYPYFYARFFAEERPPAIPLYTPPGLFELATKLMPEAEENMRSSFDVRVIAPEGPFELGPFTMQTLWMAHPVPTLGMRIEADGATLAYTADTGPSRAIVELARGSHLLLSDATWQDDDREFPQDLHLRASEAGRFAAEAGVATLVLSHIRPGSDRDRSRDEAARGFDGDVVPAEEGLTLPVKG